MIPEKYINAYKRIKAPETLHDRVTAFSVSAARSPRKQPRRLFAAISLAASFVLVTVAWIALRTGRTDTDAYITYNGNPVDTSAAIDINPTAAISPLGIGKSVIGGIPLEVHITETTTVSVSDGSITCVDENGMAADSGSLLTLSGDKDTHTVHWLADFYMASENEPFSLVLTDTHGSVTYTLTDSEGALTLTKDTQN